MFHRTLTLVQTVTIVFISMVSLGGLLSAVYDRWHPHSGSPVAAGIVLLLACAIAAVVLLARGTPFLHSTKRAVWVLFIVGIVLRTLSIALIPNKQVSDFETFHELAVAVKNGDGFAYTGSTGLREEVRFFLHRYNAKGPIPTAQRMPGTPLLMSGLYAIGGTHPFLGKLFNAFLGAGIGVCLFLLLAGTDRGLAFRAGLFSEVYPAGIFYTNLLGTEIHFTFGIVLAALLISRTVESKKTGMAVLGLVTGLLVGFTSIIRPATQYIVCGLVREYMSPAKARKTIIILGMLSIGIAIPLASWGLRNYRVFGHFEWQTTEIGLGWFTMTRGIIPQRQERTLDGLSKRFLKSQDEFEIANLGKEIGMKRFALAVRDICFVKTMAKNNLKTWRDDLDALNWCCALPGYTGCAENIRMPVSYATYRLLAKACECFYLTTLILAVFGARAFLGRKNMPRNAGVMTLLFFFVCSALLACVFQGQPRYHFPLMTVVFIMAADSFGLLRRATLLKAAKTAGDPSTP